MYGTAYSRNPGYVLEMYAKLDTSVHQPQFQEDSSHVETLQSTALQEVHLLCL